MGGFIVGAMFSWNWFYVPRREGFQYHLVCFYHFSIIIPGVGLISILFKKWNLLWYKFWEVWPIIIFRANLYQSHWLKPPPASVTLIQQLSFISVSTLIYLLGLDKHWYSNFDNTEQTPKIYLLYHLIFTRQGIVISYLYARDVRLLLSANQSEQFSVDKQFSLSISTETCFVFAMRDRL